MRVLVTGGAGFIGSHVVDALVAREHEVLVLDDLSTGRRENVHEAAAFTHGDVRDAALVERLMTAFRPEVICHQAAQTSVSVSTREPVADADVNVLGSLQLMAAAVRHGLERFVFASTGGAIYGEVPEGQRAEVGWPERPLSPYGCAKLAVESYLRAFHREHGLRHTIVRYANVYGSRQDPHGEAGVVAIFAERLLAGQPVAVFAMQDEGDEGCVRDYIYVADVVDANVRAVEGAFEGGAGEQGAAVLNVGTGQPTTTLALAQMLAKVTGRPGEIGFGPRRAGDLERSVLKPDGRLGNTVVLEEGLRKTAEWFEAR